MSEPPKTKTPDVSSVDRLLQIVRDAKAILKGEKNEQ